MTKEPDKKPLPPPVSKLGPIPPEHFEDDLPCTGESHEGDPLAAHLQERHDAIMQEHGKKKPKPE